MHRIRGWHLSAVVLAMAVLLTAAPSRLPAQPAADVAIDNDDIGGVVRSSRGPEAGVWVIAETTDLPTRFARMVVTDDQGRYVIPDLPKATYDVWVRGYGLVDFLSGHLDITAQGQRGDDVRRLAGLLEDLGVDDLRAVLESTP